MTSPRLLWDIGTAYDLFISLEVLHQPADYEVPGAWAAGVRARLPAAERETLEQGQLLHHAPLHWVHALPAPKDGATVLWVLGQVPPAKRLPLLALSPEICSDEVAEVLKNVAARGAWDEEDRHILRTCYQQHTKREKKPPPSLAKLASELDWWAHVEESGERYLKTLQAYHEVFFAEEENRIRPALQAALARAQELAERLALADLLEELSQGLRFTGPLQAAELVLAPSFWITPLVYFGKASDRRDVWLFGARPQDASLVPGSPVPDTMLRALKALSDPTRLRILKYLAEEPLTPAQIARRLRLRAPTITHHLRALRLAGLVQLTIGKDHKDLKSYAARPEAMAKVFSSLEGFLEN
ncbi:MAG: winged helix-turn-helix transcriptional regulator [Anaerolineae bacterium]|nr:winged helix-turn-helix transcriptional regulator [Anaerolineae bacterium]